MKEDIHALLWCVDKVLWVVCQHHTFMTSTSYFGSGPPCKAMLLVKGEGHREQLYANTLDSFTFLDIVSRHCTPIRVRICVNNIFNISKSSMITVSLTVRELF